MSWAKEKIMYAKAYGKGWAPTKAWVHTIIWILGFIAFVIGFVIGFAQTQDSGAAGLYAGLFMVIAVLLGYFQMIPTFIAINREHRQVAALAILDLLLGWTLFAWVPLLAWALWNFGDKDRPVTGPPDEEEGRERPTTPEETTAAEQLERRFNSEVQQRCIDDMAEHRGWGKGRGQGRKSPAAMRA